MAGVFRVISSYLLGLKGTGTAAEDMQLTSDSMDASVSGQPESSESESELPVSLDAAAGCSRRREQWTPREKLMLIKSAEELGGPELAAEHYVRCGGPSRRRARQAAIAGNIRKWAIRVRNAHSDDMRLELLACRRHGTTREQRRAAVAEALAASKPHESMQCNHLNRRVVRHPEWGGEGRESPESTMIDSE